MHTQISVSQRYEPVGRVFIFPICPYLQESVQFSARELASRPNQATSRDFKSRIFRYPRSPPPLAQPTEITDTDSRSILVSSLVCGLHERVSNVPTRIKTVELRHSYIYGDRMDVRSRCPLASRRLKQLSTCTVLVRTGLFPYYLPLSLLPVVEGFDSATKAMATCGVTGSGLGGGRSQDSTRIPRPWYTG